MVIFYRGSYQSKLEQPGNNVKHLFANHPKYQHGNPDQFADEFKKGKVDVYSGVEVRKTHS